MIIAGTGHRPEKLGGYSPRLLPALGKLAMNELRYQKPDMVISGMALGWDTALAMAAIQLKIPLLAAIAFEGVESKWRFEDQQRFFDILTCADDIIVVTPGPYAAWKLHARNKWMVDECDLLLALWDGQHTGGTAACIQYAREVRKNHPELHIVNLWPQWQAQRKATQP